MYILKNMHKILIKIKVNNFYKNPFGKSYIKYTMLMLYNSKDNQ